MGSSRALDEHQIGDLPASSFRFNVNLQWKKACFARVS